MFAPLSGEKPLGGKILATISRFLDEKITNLTVSPGALLHELLDNAI